MECVVGAAGFLGSAVVRRLASVGAQPHLFTRGDRWRDERGRPTRFLVDTEVVYWLAGSVNPATADANPRLIAADLAAMQTFCAAVRSSGVRRVVFASSGGTVYDVSAAPPYGEDAATGPLSTYGKYKLRQEEVLRDSLPPDVELVVLRVGNAYGPGQPVGTGQGVIAYWLDAALNGRPLVLFGEPSTTRDFTYIDDVSGAIAHFGHAHLVGAREVFNIGSGKATHLGELAATILDVVAEPALRLETLPARPFDVPHIWLDVRRAADAGWQASTSLTDGIRLSWRNLLRSRAAV